MNAKHVTLPPHPGTVLTAELAELNLSPAELDTALALPVGATSALLEQRSGVTGEIALRLGRYFGTTPEFWMDMQGAYDLKIAEHRYGSTISTQITPRITLDDIPDWAGGNKITDTAN